MTVLLGVECRQSSSPGDLAKRTRKDFCEKKQNQPCILYIPPRPHLSLHLLGLLSLPLPLSLLLSSSALSLQDNPSLSLSLSLLRDRLRPLLLRRSLLRLLEKGEMDRIPPIRQSDVCSVPRFGIH